MAARTNGAKKPPCWGCMIEASDAWVGCGVLVSVPDVRASENAAEANHGDEVACQRRQANLRTGHHTKLREQGNDVDEEAIDRSHRSCN